MIIRIRRLYCTIATCTCVWFMCSLLLLIYDRVTFYSSAAHGKLGRRENFNIVNGRLGKRIWLANYEKLPESHNPKGPGEYGVPVELNSTFKKRIQAGYKEHELNIVVSDMISLHRRVPDLRSKA